MTLNQALAVINGHKTSQPERKLSLVCGFEPLHLVTFLRAHAMQRLQDRMVTILTGLYGDLLGNVDRSLTSGAEGAAVIVEWSDLDPRLGIRGTGGWTEVAQHHILSTCRERLSRLLDRLQSLSAHMPVALAPPSLPMAPVGCTTCAQAGTVELELRAMVASFLVQASQNVGVRVLNLAQIEHGQSGFFDPKMELLAGFPYTISYADALARAMADVLYRPAPKKGLITDLDDTLWMGIVGEVGPDGVFWSQEQHSQIHALYQQMLARLADSGVLLAVCSKNELSTANATLARRDLLLAAESLFPICVHWGPKSAGVREILGTWNIGEETVVFVDDNAMELAEVQNVFPAITCLQFPRNNPAGVWKLLGTLRDLFGKPMVVEEDRLRAASIRTGAAMRIAEERATSPEFLRDLGGAITLDYRKNSADGRSLQLINKTNQFNLNGCRMTDVDWRCRIEQPETIVVTASYEDKLGRLGKIGVLVGKQRPASVSVEHWVISCRAFSRKIEHHMLDCLFDCDVDVIEFAYQPTDRNKPLQEFFEEIGIRQNDSGAYCLTRSQFRSRCEALPHRISAYTNGQN